jgi:predicted flap endonuclease-1-like 5' DNA nuclease
VSMSLKNLDGLGADVIDVLRQAGIRTSDKLLEAAKSPKGRKELAAKTGIDPQRLLRFANLADKMRVKGLGKEYAELLCHVGVDTVRELKYRNPAKLATAMRAKNDKLRLVRLVPTEKAVGRWVEAARKLPQKISY